MLFALLLPMLLTETRSSFIALALATFAYALSYLITSKSFKKTCYILILLTITVVVSFQAPSVKNRVLDGVNQVQAFSDGNFSSSGGARINMWLTGWDLGKDRALIGYSKGELQKALNAGFDSGEYSNFLKRFLSHSNPNFHNQFIQLFVTSGIVGLAVMLSYLLLPLFLVLSAKHDGLDSVLAKVFAFQIFSLTCLWFDSIYLHNHTMYLMSFFILIVLSLTYHEKG
ncbi:O-antigen ligase [Vibrio ponticus]|nr:O-antigen ligase [Vibrio ponticus]